MRQPPALLHGLLLAAGMAATLGVAWLPDAFAQTRSSGGYSRPSGGSYGRTPSVGGTRIAPRTPSTSGGYSSPPSGSYGRRPSVSVPSWGGSAADRGVAREGSASALDRYRAQQLPRAPAPAPAPSGSTGGGWQGRWGGDAGSAGGSWGTRTQDRTRVPDWYRERGWSPSGGGGFGGGGGLGAILGGNRGFGIFDGLFLAYLLENLSRPGSADFFRSHQDDPGYREWRGGLDQRAASDAELKRRLDTLDREIAARPDAPRDRNYLPPDVPPEIAIAPRPDARTPSTAESAEESGGLGMIWVVLVLVVGAGLLFVMLRRRGATSGGGGAKVGPLDTAGAVLRRKLEGEGQPYVPSRFRLGMSVAADPTPFLLAAGATKVPAPDTAAGPLVVQGLGQVEGGAVDYTRLHLGGDGRGFFQLHLDTRGDPDECRYFGLIDEVQPADPAEWGVWLDPAEGLIGWPEFQTKDGAVYARAWAPGQSRIPPRQLTETIEATGGTRRLRSQAMLYGAATGLAAPAPPREYILVAAVEAEGQAWVEVFAGIDINPAALNLA